ncbi:MerR family transcriptional regulator [Neobacillus sp. K501]
MKTFTLKEVSKKINVPPATLRKWEKDLKEILIIPRTKQGARLYSDLEINLLMKIKEMTINQYNNEMIIEALQKKMEPPNEEESNTPTSSLAIVSETITPIQNNETAIESADQFFDAMDTYKQTFLNEVKDEIRSVLRKEVVEEFRKEISKGTLVTVKTLSDSIYKSSANTQAELEEISDQLEQVSERTTERLRYLSDNITHASIETSEEIYTLSKQLSDSTEELANYVTSTHSEISSLAEAIESEREDSKMEREQYLHEIRQREAAFQNMLSSFRDVAAAKEKKWWKFWS